MSEIKNLPAEQPIDWRRRQERVAGLNALHAALTFLPKTVVLNPRESEALAIVMDAIKDAIQLAPAEAAEAANSEREDGQTGGSHG